MTDSNKTNELIRRPQTFIEFLPLDITKHIMYLINMINKISNLTLDPLKAMATGRSFALRATRLTAARRLAIHAVVILVTLKLVTIESKSFQVVDSTALIRKRKTTI